MYATLFFTKKTVFKDKMNVKMFRNMIGEK